MVKRQQDREQSSIHWKFPCVLSSCGMPTIPFFILTMNLLAGGKLEGKESVGLGASTHKWVRILSPEEGSKIPQDEFEIR